MTEEHLFILLTLAVLLTGNTAPGAILPVAAVSSCILVIPVSVVRKVLLAAALGLSCWAMPQNNEPTSPIKLEEGERIMLTGKLTGAPVRSDFLTGRITVNAERMTRSTGCTSSAHSRVICYLPWQELPEGLSSGWQVEIPLRCRDQRFYPAGEAVFSPSGRTGLTAYHRYRRTIQKHLLEGITDLPWEAQQLASALLLGWPIQRWGGLFELSRSAGTAHVMALSGLHAGIIASIVMLILQPVAGRIASRWCALVLLLLFCILVGPRESLIRAVIMFWLCMITKKRGMELLALSCLIQLIIRPQDVSSVGFLLSYSALAGIFTGTAWCADHFPWQVPPAARSMAAMNCCAFIGAAPILVLHDIPVRSAGLLLSIPSILLVTLFIWGSILYLLAGRPIVLAVLLQECSLVMERMWAWGSSLPDGVIPAAVIGCALTILVLLQYGCARSSHGTQLSGKPVQFPSYDQGSFEDEGTEDDQAVRSELSH